LKFSLSMPVGELQQRLDEYLSRYETGNKIQLPATAKPAIRGPLYLIGMVQNDKLNPSRPDFGRAILQSAIVPVTGFSAATPEKETTEPAATPTEKAAPAAVVAPAEASPPAPALPME
jgi:hypothetical protein